MSTEVKVPGTESEQILTAVLDQWKAGIDSHDPQRVAAMFTDDGIFQGLRPYSVGPQGVVDYYDSQPHGLTVVYHILETRQLAADAILGYLRADFSFPDDTMISVNIGVLIGRRDGGWRIRYYQASRIG